MSDRLKNPMRGPTRRQRILPVHLLLIDDRHKEIGRNKQQSPTELGWRYPDNGERMLIELDCAPHHSAIILETAVPICVAEHEIRHAVGAMLIGTTEETAEIRLNSEHVEVVSRRRKARGDGWIVARVQPDKSKIKCR